MQCFCSHKNGKDIALLVLRLALGAVFVYHGYSKLGNIEMTATFFDKQGILLPGFFAWVVGLVEFVGGLMLILGVYAKTAGMLLGFTMLVALLVVHLGQPWAGSELPLLAFGGSVVMAMMGAGKWRLLQNQECMCGACGSCATGEDHKH